MSSQFASAVYPVARRFIGVAKEATFGTAVSPTVTLPLTEFKPVDKIGYLEDTAWRNAMAGLYNLVQGTKIADLTMGGPFFPDTFGYLLASMLGDYYQAVTGTATTPTTLASSYTAGGTSVSVTANTGLSTGATFAVGTLSSTSEEVRTVATISGGGPYTVTFTAPMYQNHASGNPVTAYTSVTTYTHNFSLLNSGTGMGGTPNAQPPTYTWTDSTGVPASTGARQYAATCLSELAVTGTSTDLVMWDGKGVSLASAIAAQAPTSNPSAVAVVPSWRSTISLGGSEFNNTEYKITFTRVVEPVFPNSNQQDPFAIVRGKLLMTMGVKFNPAVDESEYLLYFNGTQPSTSIVADNGLAGSSHASLTFACVPTFDTGEIMDSQAAFGYDLTSKFIATTANAGPSGGFSPVLVTLVNSVVNY